MEIRVASWDAPPASNRVDKEGTMEKRIVVYTFKLAFKNGNPINVSLSAKDATAAWAKLPRVATNKDWNLNMDAVVSVELTSTLVMP